MSDIDFQNGVIVGMASKGLTVSAQFSYNAFYTIGHREVKLFADGIQRTYGVLAFKDGVWKIYLPRHFNHSFVTAALDAHGANARGASHTARAPSAAYQMQIT